MCVFPADLKATLCCLVSVLILQTGVLFCSLLSAMLFAFLCFVLVISLFKMLPPAQCGSAVQCSQVQEAMTCLTEKIHVRFASSRLVILSLAKSSMLMNHYPIVNQDL